jgi:hypothetical protein
MPFEALLPWHGSSDRVSFKSNRVYDMTVVMRTIQSKITLALLLLLGLTAEAFAAPRIQLINATNTPWMYRPNTTDPAYVPADAWTVPEFDDSGWSGPGVGIFGRESTPLIYPFPFNTPIPAPSQGGPVSTYLRTHFNWDHETRGVSLYLTNYIDDGMVVYLNGVELWAFNMPARPVAWNAATLPQSANPLGEAVPVITNVVANLQEGDNVIAVQFQQHGTGSSDDVFTMWMYGEAATPIVITDQPDSTTVVQSRAATFSVAATGSNPRYQWQRSADGGANWTDIPGATAASYTLYPTTLSDDAAQFRAVVSNAVNTLISDVATLTITPDMTPPTVVGASSVHALEISIQFDELMESNTTTSTFGYTVNGGPGAGGPSVTNVVLKADGTGVRLQLDVPFTSPFTVDVTEAHDYALNPIAPGTTVNGTKWADSQDVGAPALAGNAFSAEPGDVEITAGGADIWGMSDQFHFVHNQRTGDFDVKVKVTRLDPSNAWAKGGLLARETLDGPSATIEAYTTPDRPPGTRTYEAGRRPTTGVNTLDWGGRPPSGLPNAWVRLRRNGDSFRAYHGTDGVNWSLYAGPVTQPMSATLFLGAATTSHNVGQTTLAIFQDLGDVSYPGAVVTIDPQPANQTVQTHQAVTFTSAATVSGAPAGELFYQWERSPDGVTWTNIPGANGTSVSIQFPAGDDDGDSFRLVASVPGASATSDAATLTLTPDTVRPTVTSVVGVSSTRVLVIFSEPMDASAGDNFIYTIDQGNTVTDAQFLTTNRINLTIEATTPLVAGNTYTLSVVANDDQMGGFIGAIDPSGNPIDPNPAMKSFVSQNYPGDPNGLRELPTNTKRALGSLPLRGFDGRMVQNPVNIANDNAVAERMLAGTYIDPNTGMPYPNIAPLPVFVENNVVNYTGSGNTGTVPGDTQFPGYTNPADNMAMEILTYLELTSGIYRMGVNSDDGFRVSPARNVSDPNNSITLGEFNGGRGVADTVFDFIVTEDGLYPFRRIWEEGQGDAGCEWWTRGLSGSPTTLLNAAGGIRAFRGVLPQPRLAISRSGNQVVLSWSDSEGTYQLQESSNLTPGSWSDVSGASGSGGNYSITITPSSTGERYYRLRSP